MNTTTSLASSSASHTRGTAPQVWDRLWRHVPSAARDDELLTRERRSPRWSLFVARLEATFGSLVGLRTIELGSGRGDLSVLLAERGADVTLFDASDVGLDQARRRFDRRNLPASFVRGDLLGPLDEWAGQFHVALSSGVIEHFAGDERTRAVRAHHEVLRDGGLTMISVPNALCPSYRLWKCYLELRGWWPYGLELPYTKSELLRRAHDVGFFRTDARCVGFWQSVGDHWGRSILKRTPDWVNRRSILDNAMGMSLLLFGWRDGDRSLGVSA